MTPEGAEDFNHRAAALANILRPFGAKKDKESPHGFRVGGLRRAAAPPVATTRGPFGAGSQRIGQGVLRQPRNWPPTPIRSPANWLACFTKAASRTLLS